MEGCGFLRVEPLRRRERQLPSPACSKAAIPLSATSSGGRMSGFPSGRPENGPTKILKSFGRRRRTKVLEERTRGGQASVYGDLGF